MAEHKKDIIGLLHCGHDIFCEKVLQKKIHIPTFKNQSSLYILYNSLLVMVHATSLAVLFIKFSKYRDLIFLQHLHKNIPYIESSDPDC